MKEETPEHVSECFMCIAESWALYSNHRQLLRYEKNGLESAFGIKMKHFKKELGFENVSSRAEVHSKICDQLIETLIGGEICFLKTCRVSKDPPF
jgi:hypothetical protein